MEARASGGIHADPSGPRAHFYIREGRMDHARGWKGSKEARPGYLVSLTLCVFCPYTEKIIFPGYCTEEKSLFSVWHTGRPV